MKMLLTSLLLLIGVTNIFGAEPKNVVFPPSYEFSRTTFLYDNLGFGNNEAMLHFMTNQIALSHVGLYQEDGTGSFGPLLFYYDKSTETLQQFIARAANGEFQSSVSRNQYDCHQMFTLKFFFMNGVAGAQFWSHISFVPEKSSNNTYAVPEASVNSMKFESFSDRISIVWPKITRATLSVFNPSGSIIYKGDSKNTGLNDLNLSVNSGADLMIARRFITNGYTGVLTVSVGDKLGFSNSGMYLLKDGSFVTNPRSIPPLMGITATNGKTIITVNGAPNQMVSILSYPDLGHTPHFIQDLSLNSIGSASWTNAISSSMGFYKTVYGNQ